MFRGMIGNGMVELGVFGGALFAQVKARGRGGLEAKKSSTSHLAPGSDRVSCEGYYYCTVARYVNLSLLARG
jgi:hypothetical protein